MKVNVSNFQKTGQKTGQRKTRLSIRHIRQIEKDCLKALRLLRLQRAELSIIFAGPQKMRRLNRIYRGIDAPTDVLSFPIFPSAGEFPREGDFLLGDIFINTDEVLSQAKESGLSPKHELRRLMVHGLLHLIGYDHDTAETYKRMRRKERSVLGALSVANQALQKRASS